MLHRLQFFTVVVVAGTLGAPACAKKPPAPVPEAPALVLPEVPPRVLAPLAPEPEPSSPEPEPETPAPKRAPRPKPRTEAAKPVGPADPAKSESAAEQEAGETKPGEPKAGDAKPGASETPVLRMPQTADDAGAERRIREVLGRASQDLAKVNVGALGADGRTQFETARRFIDQAGEALKVRNYMFASYLATKAEALARGLSGR